MANSDSFSKTMPHPGSKLPALATSAGVIRLGAKKRAAGFFLGTIAAMLRARRAASPDKDLPTRRVLILEPFGMGDIISYQPFIHSLLASNYEVCICGREEWRDFYPEIKCWVASRIPWSSYDEESKYGLARYRSPAFREFWRQLKDASRGAIGIDTRGDIRSVLLLYLAGCRSVLTLSNYLGSDLRNARAAARSIPFDPNLRRWEMNMLFLQAFGVTARPGSPRFPHLARPRVPFAERRLGIVPIAPWNGKLWGLERWREFIVNAGKVGWDVTALCGPKQSVAARNEVGEQVRVVECPSIKSWAVELQKFSAIVTVDTGPMHLADALGLPLVALFGQGLLPLWAPSGPLARVVSHQDDADFQVCHPVEANTPLGRHFMRRIQPAEALETLRQIAEQASKT